jgi:hypothetical protein
MLASEGADAARLKPLPQSKRNAHAYTQALHPYFPVILNFRLFRCRKISATVARRNANIYFMYSYLLVYKQPDLIQ